MLKNDVEIAISAKNYELLICLVRNEGKVLTHNELLETVWEGTFVEQSNLKKGISAIRQILGETPESSLFIKTIPRKGYSFIASVEFVDEPAETPSTPETKKVDENAAPQPLEPKPETSAPRPDESQRSSFRKAGPYLAVALVVVVLFVAGFVWLNPFAKKATRFSVENVQITKLTNDGNCNDASISADGNFILCGVKSLNGSSLITRQISSNSRIQLLPWQKNISFWSYKITPDGNSVYYMLHDIADPSRDGLFQIPFLGGNPRKISNNALHITFSPDGKLIGFVRLNSNRNQIMISNLDGTDERQIAEYDEGHRIWGLNFSPDGKTLLSSARLQSSERTVGFVDEISVADGSKKGIFENERLIVSATWMPDKSSIILGMRELHNEVRQIWQYFPSNKELIRVTNDNNTYRFPVLNQSGTIISVSQESVPSTIFLGETGNGGQTIAADNGLFDHLSNLSNGELLVTSFDEGNGAVWILNRDLTKKQPLTDGKDGVSLRPKLSSDGKSVVFTSIRSGNRELWKINLDGSGLTQLTFNRRETIFDGKLLANNNLIGVSNNKDGSFIWRQPPSGDNVVLDEKIGFEWDVSPDDKLLVYDKFNQSTKQSEIIVKSLENDQIIKTYQRKVTNVLRWFDQTSFIYQVQDFNKFQVFKQDINQDAPVLIYEHTGEQNEVLRDFVLLPDGKRFNLIRAKYLSDAVTIRLVGNP